MSNLCPTCEGLRLDPRSLGDSVPDPCWDCDHEGTREAYDRVAVERDRGA